MTQSLESLGNALTINRETLDGISPGVFVNYNALRQKSSHVELATNDGIIKKVKKRKPEKAIYEYLSLELWNELLKLYSTDDGNLLLRAPKPIGLSDLNTEEPKLYMEFMNGYTLRELSQLKRTTPVSLRAQETPLPLYPACAVHLGFLNAIKEAESLYHSDYDTRHVIFSPVRNLGMSVIDVENSRIDGLEMVCEESSYVFDEFKTKVPTDKDIEAISSWYTLGKDTFKVFEDGPQIGRLVENIKKKYDVDFDFNNMSINGYRLKPSS